MNNSKPSTYKSISTKLKLQMQNCPHAEYTFQNLPFKPYLFSQSLGLVSTDVLSPQNHLHSFQWERSVVSHVKLPHLENQPRSDLHDNSFWLVFSRMVNEGAMHIMKVHLHLFRL